MNVDQLRAHIREVVVAAMALLASFGVSMAADVTALAVAAGMLVWALLDPKSRPWPSFLRKVLQSIPPVLTAYDIITLDQAVAMSGFILVVVSFWTHEEKANPTQP